MKLLIPVALILSSTAAFAFSDDPLKSFDATVRLHSTSVITWVVADDVQKACNDSRIKHGGTPYTSLVNGCVTFWKEKNECIIITGKRTTMHTLGHEVRHCFQGHWH